MKTAMSKTKSTFDLEEFEGQGKGFFEAATGFFTALAILIGLWSLACLIGAVVRFGPLDVLRGWLGAVTGI